MPPFSLKTLLLLTGIALIILGYWLLAVPPEADHQQILERAKSGVFSVVGGSACVMLWLAKR
jgi:hypothetical protein